MTFRISASVGAVLLAGAIAGLPSSSRAEEGVTDDTIRIGGLGAILARSAGQILRNTEAGVNDAHTDVSAVRHSADLPPQVCLQIARKLLHGHGPCDSR